MGMECESVSKIFAINDNAAFADEAYKIFTFQFAHNPVYEQWCKLLFTDAQNTLLPHQIPFLPISFFKSHKIASTNFDEAAIFESSGTLQTINSKHFVKDIDLYKTSFIKAFQLFYGDIKDWCIIGLLPSYLERNGSSLIMMVDELIKMSNHAISGFYLDDHEKLHATLQMLEAKQQKTLLIGVTFGLLDFTEKFSMQLQHTVVMETGGMKGRRKEMTRAEVHEILKQKLGVEVVHSEYGMTELLSQAYSLGNGKFMCPPWMKVLVRDEEDPLVVKEKGRGVLNIIDLANAYSCSFIATEDVGIVYDDGSFEVHGRLDNSDIRGCSLLVI